MNEENQFDIYSSIEAFDSKLLQMNDIDADQKFEIYSEEFPQLNILRRISTFGSNEFHYRWSVLIFIINLYNLFSVGYFLGLNTYPSGIWLGLELISEGVIVADLVIRYRIKGENDLDKKWFMQDPPTSLVWTCLILSSFPYSITLELSGKIQANILAFLRLFKLLRMFQVYLFFTNQELITKPQHQPYWSIGKILIVFFTLTHYSSVVWLINCDLESINCFHENNTELENYVEALFWASETFTGVVLNRTVSSTQKQRFIAILVMIIGLVAFGVVFCRFAMFLHEKNKEKVQKEFRVKTLKKWCENNLVPYDLRVRIFTYQALANDETIGCVRVEPPEDLPLSLRSELALHLYKDLITKVKLFELGEPSFMISIVRCFQSEIFLPGDLIIRRGDFADRMYFINKGSVEVLATDEVSQISLLEEGNYFGEIGILLKCNRTVSVKSLKICFLASISNENLLGVLEKFPEYSEFLKKVALQRVKTCEKEDFDLNYDLVEDNYSSSDSDKSGELETPQYFTPAEHSQKPWYLKFVTVRNSKSRKGIIQIDPLSFFFYLWTGILCAAYTVCLFAIPYSIAFSPNFTLLILDAACYMLFLVDIIVKYNSSIITKYQTYIHDKEVVQKLFFTDYFTLDILSVIPSDWVYCAFECQSSSMYYLKLLRLLKLWRLWHLLKIITSYSKIPAYLVKLFAYLYLFFTAGHITACLLHIFSFSNSNEYTYYLYWSYSIYSTSAYGDLNLSGTACYIFLIFLFTTNKIFTAFLFAECSQTMLEVTRPVSSFLAKFKPIEEWMVHTKLPAKLSKKVKSFYQLIWNRYQGLTDEEILKELPECLSTDLRLHFFENMLLTGMFPTDEKGAILAVVRKCRVSAFPKGMNVIYKDELGLEIFFILKGCVQIVNHSGIVLEELLEGSFFGEIDILSMKWHLRKTTARAKTDLTLAVLGIEDFEEIEKMHPGFKRKVKVNSQELSRNAFDENPTIENNLKDGITEIKHLDNDSENIDSSKLDIKEFNALNETEILSIQNRIKFVPFALKLKQNRFRKVVYFTVWMWNFAFVPVQVAFKLEYSIALTLFEMLTVAFYSFMGIYYIVLYHTVKTLPGYDISHNITLFKTMYHFLLAVPFAFIFKLTDFEDPQVIVLLLSYIRISNIWFFIKIFSQIKSEIVFHYRVILIIQILIAWFCFVHIIACNFIWISIGKAGVWTEAFSTHTDLYISSLYWAISTSAHSTLGDISPQTYNEKIFTCIAQFISSFFLILIFTIIVSSMVIGRSNLRHKTFADFTAAYKFLQQKEIESKFQRHLSDYFSELWGKNKGITEEDVLNPLPCSLRSEILLHQHRLALKKSESFQGNSEKSISLLHSIFRIMQIQYNLIGDIILRMDDSSSDMYIILDGEVKIISIEGDAILGTLTEGDHFGETNILLGTRIRTATVVATKITQMGVVGKKDLKKLLQAYPEWKEKLLASTNSRMLKTFKTTDIEEINSTCEKFCQMILDKPQISRSYTRRSEQLIAHAVADVLSNQTTDNWLFLNMLHTFFVLYSCISIPLEIASKEMMNNWLMAMEVLSLSESIIFFSTTVKSVEIKRKDFKNIIKLLWKNHVFVDIAALSPFNLIFPLLQITSPGGVILVMRSIRIICIFRIHSIFSKFCESQIHLFLLFRFLENLIYIVLFLHWCACLLKFNYNCEVNATYLDSLYLMINIVTNTGHTDMHPCTVNTKIQTIAIIFISEIAIAMIFGWFIYAITYKTNSILHCLQRTSLPFAKVSKAALPSMLRHKLEAYLNFTAVLMHSYGEIVSKDIYTRLPKNIVHNFIYEYSRHGLKKLPFLQKNDSEVLMMRISLKLESKIFLPGDYLIYKDDIGDEMYFIDFGRVHIIAPDNSKVIKVLSDGDFFGEMALVNNSKRMCSVIASSLCLVRTLNKSNFHRILQGFPDVLQKIREQSEARNRETSSVSKNNAAFHSEDIEEKKIYNHLSMYSLISTSYLAPNREKSKITVISGMQNIRTETNVAMFEKNRTVRFHKRRPDVNGQLERRHSEEILGKAMLKSRFEHLKAKYAKDF